MLEWQIEVDKVTRVEATIARNNLRQGQPGVWWGQVWASSGYTEIGPAIVQQFLSPALPAHLPSGRRQFSLVTDSNVGDQLFLQLFCAHLAHS